MEQYDYYGKYNKKIDNSFSVYEIHKQQKEKVNKRNKIYETVLGRVYTAIKNAVTSEAAFCFFKLPEYIMGFPIYNMTECLLFIMNKLKTNGYQTKYCHPHLIYITWPMIDNTLKLEDDKPKSHVKQPMSRPVGSRNSDPNLLSNLKLNYKSTNEYKPSGAFVKNNKPQKKTLFF